MVLGLGIAAWCTVLEPGPGQTATRPTSIGLTFRRPSRMRADDSILSYTSLGWPICSVERFPPFSPKQFKNPVLIIGNYVRASRPRAQSSHNFKLITVIHRLT